MQPASGRSSRATQLGTIELVGPLTAGRFAFLASLGALTILLHETFHYPLKMPGHHGLEGMALLLIGRLCCTDRWAATLVGLSAAVTASASGVEHGFWSSGLYAIPGIVLDLTLLAFSNWRAHLFLVPVAVAFAHAAKPIARFGIAEAFGIPFGSLANGIAYPFSTHLAYGFAGAMIAAALWRATLKQAERQS
jgi:hypothetical protein